MKNQDSITFKAIMTTTDSWKAIYNNITGKELDLDLTFFDNDYDEIIFIGCGSSYCISMCSAFFTRSFFSKKVLPLPTSELIFNTEAYIDKDKKYLVIAFSKSGETFENIFIINKLKTYKNIKTFAFSCAENSSLTKNTDYYFICKNVVEVPFMTKSFSSMLFAYCLILSKYLNKKELINEFNNLINYVEKNISFLFDDISSYIKENDFNSFFILGNGFNYGLAEECDLKIKEMSHIPSYAYYLDAFDHGPMLALSDKSLCLILTIQGPEENIVKRITGYTNIVPKMIIVGDSKIKHEKIKFLMIDSNIKNNLVKSFINIPVFQILAYAVTIRKKFNPDVPNPYSSKFERKFI